LSDGTAIASFRDDDPLIPASILKVATAYCALEELGRDYRFETLFLSDFSGTLFIKGSGDPGLVSETLQEIAIAIAEKVHYIDRIVVDTSLFSSQIAIDGSDRSLNPYDAKNAAFVANYSTALVTRSKRDGAVSSAEPHTPLTPLSQSAGLRLARGSTERINLSQNMQSGTRYGGELLAAFLRSKGVAGAMRVDLGGVDSGAKVLLRHRSQNTLEDTIRGMLEFSNNFTANQIFLTLGHERFGAPATVPKGKRALSDCLSTRVGWRDFQIEEGSGLSRKNRVTGQQMTALLKRFERYSFLLPNKQGYLAKTGTLRGVNSLAGYLDLAGSNGQNARFSIIINSEVPHLHKFKVADELRRYLNGGAVY
jgi:D-alanyl-D-alanine carboxypeptidase/D-alanyl-D-alanine-endopeptidase (penicillin-binding protein 4)